MYLMLRLYSQLEKGISFISFAFLAFYPWIGCLAESTKELRKHATITLANLYEKLYSNFGYCKPLGEQWYLYDVKLLQIIYRKVGGSSEMKRIQIKQFLKREKNFLCKVTCYQNYKYESEVQKIY